MSTENPTADSGASTLDRIENFLNAGSGDEVQDPNKEVDTQGSDTTDPDKAAETQEAPDAEVEKPADDDTDPSEEPQVSISDVAQYLGVEETLLDVSDEGDILIKVKIDGQESTAKLPDVIKSYQLQGHVDNKARQAAETERALQERAQQLETRKQEETQDLERAYQFMEQMVLGKYAGIDWQHISQTDPAQWAAQKQAMESDAAELQKLNRYLDNRRQQEQQAVSEARSKKITAGLSIVAAEVPGWQPNNEVDAALNKFAQQDLRLSPEQLEKILTEFPGAFGVMWEVKQHRQNKQNASVAEKKVRTAPKLVKPGQSVTAKERTGENVRGLKEQIRKSGGKQGITDYLIATGKV